MRLFFTFMLLFGIHTVSVRSQYFDEPYEFRDGFKFVRAFLDSANQLYFFSRDEFAIVDEETRTWKYIDTFKTDTKSYEIEYIFPEFTHFGEKLNMTSFGTKDSTYFSFFNQDTTIILNSEQLNPKFKWKNTTGYSNHKFWFSGYWENIYTFDENTLKLDSIPLDSIKLHQWNQAPMNFQPYKEGILYVGSFVNKLYYYSENEQWEVDLDSIATMQNSKWEVTNNMDFDGKRLVLAGWNQHIGIFDVETFDFNIIDLAKTNLIEENPDVVLIDSTYDLQPHVNFDCEGNIYLSIRTITKAVKYKRIDDYNYEYLEHEDFSVVHQVRNSGRNSNWYSGLFEENGKSYYKAVEYFPDGNTVEAFPSIVPIKVYPNPAETYTNVLFYLKPSTRSKVKFEIYNYMGQLIKKVDNEMEYDSNTGFATKRLNTADLKTGIYYLLVDNEAEKRLFCFAVN